jgi:dihydroorotase
MPAMAEAIRLQRDLELLAYSGSRLHVASLSTAEGVELVRAAKTRKLQVTASVAAHHLVLDDGCLRGFETNYKVMPPLRDAAHIEALREGLKDGTIDAVVSDHRPEDVEHKVMEFGRASFGAIGLETAFAAAHTTMKARMSLSRLVQRFCHGPRRVLGLEVPHVQEEAPAELTLFLPEQEWTYTAAEVVSRSQNSPFLGQPFTGRVMGIHACGQLRLHPALAGVEPA